MDASSADRHEKSQFKCRLCDAVYTNLRALKGHAKDHTKTSLPYQCIICPFVSNEKSALQRHIRTHNGEKPFQCRVCKDSFSTKSNGKRHLVKIHEITNEEQLLSLLKENEPNAKENLTPSPAMEVKPQSLVAPPLLQECAKLLTMIAKMAEANVGSDIPPVWSPGQLVEQFPLSSEAGLVIDEDLPLNLTKRQEDNGDMNMPSEEKESDGSTSCEEDYQEFNGSAGFFVETIYNVNKKEMEENGKQGKTSAYSRAPNRVRCSVCNITFPWESSLRRHMLVHTGEKPFKCDFCPLKFTTKSNCIRHQKRKHRGEPSDAKSDEKSLKCTFCSKTFNYAHRLHQHMKMYCLPRARYEKLNES